MEWLILFLRYVWDHYNYDNENGDGDDEDYDDGDDEGDDDDGDDEGYDEDDGDEGDNFDAVLQVRRGLEPRLRWGRDQPRPHAPPPRRRP